MTEQLTGKVAVVTGAASGIGLALAERFVAEGMRVVMSDIETERLEKEATRLSSFGSVLAVTTDVTRIEAVEELRARTEAAFGAAFVVCNNAGVEAPAEYAVDIPLSYWQWIVSVNLWGVSHGCLTFLPGMIERGMGHIVNTSSLSGLLAVPFHVPYCMTKHAIIGLSMGLQAEQEVRGSKVKLHVLCPPLVNSGILDSVRNFPAELGELSLQEVSEAGQRIEEWERTNIVASVAPSEMARLVVDAVHADRFWALPDWDMVLPGGVTLQDYIRDLWSSSVDGRDLPIMNPRH